MYQNTPGLDTALAGLESIVKGGPLNPMDAPGGQPLASPGSPLAKDAPNDLSKADDDEVYDLGDEDDDDEELEKSILDYAGLDVIKALTGDDDQPGTEHPLITLTKGLDLMAGDLTEAIATGFAGQAPVNEALVKALGSAIQRSDAQTELIKGLVGTISDLNGSLEGINKQLVELGAKPVPRRAVTPGVQVLEKAVAGTPAAGTESHSTFPATYGLHPEKLREKLVKGIGTLGLDMGLAGVMDRTGTVEPAVFERIKDL
jgi:hypothetical protein